MSSSLDSNLEQHSTCSVVDTKQERTVTPSTVEKWKSELSELNMEEWLLFDSDANGKVRNLRCKFCIQFEDKICDLPNFSDILIHGFRNYKKPVVEDNAKNKNTGPMHPRIFAYKLYLEASNKSIEKRSQILVTSDGQVNIDVVSSLKKVPPEVYERLKEKFQTTYFTIKNEFPIAACKTILKLEQLHGVDIGNKYLNDTSLGMFIDYIGKDLTNKLSDKMSGANFFSVFCDASMDVATRENEVIYCLHFDPIPPG